MVQHIQSPHARDEIKLNKYVTHFLDGDGHAPTPNYTTMTTPLLSPGTQSAHSKTCA